MWTMTIEVQIINIKAVFDKVIDMCGSCKFNQTFVGSNFWKNSNVVVLYLHLDDVFDVAQSYSRWNFKLKTTGLSVCHIGRALWSIFFCKNLQNNYSFDIL